MNDEFVDWIIWKIMEMQDDIKHHAHHDAMTIIGGFPSFKSVSRLDHLESELKKADQQIQKFNELKNQMIHSPSPVAALYSKFTQLEEEYRIEKEKRDDELKDLRKNMPKLDWNAITSELKGLFEKEDAVICPKKEEEKK